MHTYEYPKADITVDIVVFNEDGTKVLLIKRKNEPFKDCWALPGGYVDIAKNETTRQAARRELQEETFLFMRLFSLGVYDEPGRDPRGRVISVAFWDYMDSDYVQVAKAGDDASEVEWHTVSGILNGSACVELAFDHFCIIADAFDEYKRVTQ